MSHNTKLEPSPRNSTPFKLLKRAPKRAPARQPVPLAPFFHHTNNRRNEKRREAKRARLATRKTCDETDFARFQIQTSNAARLSKNDGLRIRWIRTDGVRNAAVTTVSSARLGVVSTPQSTPPLTWARRAHDVGEGHRATGTNKHAPDLRFTSRSEWSLLHASSRH